MLNHGLNKLYDSGKEGEEMHMAEKGNEGHDERGRQTNNEGQAAGAKRKQWEEKQDR